MFLLSFDIEEFDMPFEYDRQIAFEDQISISEKGTGIILDLLAKHELKATFFATVVFAERVPSLIARIRDEGHELASHTWYHSEFETAHLAASRDRLRELSGLEIRGFRMPRMQDVDVHELEKAGYLYNSSINPTWLPGRYDNRHLPRTHFREGGIVQLPASVSPGFRIPLFWLSFHNFPLRLYKYLVKRTYKTDGYVNIYFHPWEFTDLRDKARFGFPGYVGRNSGKDMVRRMDELMRWGRKEGFVFGTISEFLKNLKII